MFLLRSAAGVLSAALLVAGAGTVCGQDYPNKPIRIITTTPGGGGDFDSRIVAQGISGPLGQPVIVENRTSGIVAAEFVAKAPPDGYTLHVNGASMWINPLMRKMTYDMLNDFLPVTLITRQVNVLTVHPSLPVKSVKELIALAKAKPGELNYSHSGVGGPSHLGAELFKSMAGVNIVSIPYKGGAPAVTALRTGEVQITIADQSQVVQHVKSGRLRALAVTTLEPSALVPGLPTVAASGLPGFESVGITALFVPAKTPAAIINRVNQEVARYLNQPDVKERLFSAGEEVLAGSPEQSAAFIKSDMAKWGKLIKDANIKVD